MIELRRVAAVILLFLGVGVGLHLLMDPLRGGGQPATAKAMTLGAGWWAPPTPTPSAGSVTP